MAFTFIIRSDSHGRELWRDSTAIVRAVGGGRRVVWFTVPAAMAPHQRLEPTGSARRKSRQRLAVTASSDSDYFVKLRC